ncbi:MAG: thioredoxin family protein [Bacilli bacterium]|nr:thioredoxin family protein [Bacilli bacterium]
MILKKLDNNNFSDFINSKENVLVEFYTDWCKYCQIVDTFITKENNKTIKLGRVNIDQNLELAWKHQIDKVPTFLLFNSGNILKKKLVISEKEFEYLINE